jgi:hypothetical protein
MLGSTADIQFTNKTRIMVVCSVDDHPDNQGWFLGLDADYDNPNKAAYFQLPA